jgi:hypothetical protein
MLILCLNKIFGKEGLKFFFEEVNKLHFSLCFIGISLGGCLLIGAVLLLTGLLKETLKPKLIPCFMISLPVSMIMGYAQFHLLAIDTKYWIFMGIMLPIVLIPVSTYMMNRDRKQRCQIIEE